MVGGPGNGPSVFLLNILRELVFFWSLAPVQLYNCNLLRIYLNPDPVGLIAQVPFPLQGFPRPQGRRPGRALQAR
jgi:hypothetical protein